LKQVNEPSVPDPSNADLAPATSAAADAPDSNPIDLDAIERDLTDVQTALERLNDGSYWTDEVTGEPIADDVLVAHPTARTATPTLS
jgi:RNA polymerase-binding transcription factor DksA